MQVVLVDALAGLAVDAARCVDYAAEVAAAQMAARYGLPCPRALDGRLTAEGFRWYVVPHARSVLPASRMRLTDAGPVFLPDTRRRAGALPDWAEAIPLAARREALRLGDGDLLRGVRKLLKNAVAAIDGPENKRRIKPINNASGN